MINEGTQELPVVPVAGNAKKRCPWFKLASQIKNYSLVFKA
jgi:hypothetical protein